MPVATVSPRGQITIPVEFRHEFGLKPGTRVFIEVADGAIRITPALGILSLRGFLGKAGSPEEEEKAMQEAVAEHVMAKR